MREPPAALGWEVHRLLRPGGKALLGGGAAKTRLIRPIARALENRLVFQASGLTAGQT
jgi:hypothetical protein